MFNSSLKKGISRSDLRRSLSKQSILSEGRRGRDQATVNKRSRLIGEEAVETGNVSFLVVWSLWVSVTVQWVIFVGLIICRSIQKRCNHINFLISVYKIFKTRKP